MPDRQSSENMRVEEIRHLVEEKLASDPERLEHTRNVVLTAIELCRYHAIDKDKVVTAALLHDVTKLDSEQTTDALVQDKFGKQAMTDYPSPIRHALTAMIFAEEVCGITDQGILMAIKNHASGRPKMDDVEKVVYISDYIEPGRKHVSEALRSLARLDLDRAVCVITDLEIEYLVSLGLKASKLMLALREECKNKYKDVNQCLKNSEK
ncbi:MAG: bis(5'-nucleosyl)-tetraphosphatase (symmetrical) YqeK [Bacilli bacterium]|nr:bis(5'-nucleosyl)-tetraphosphatase (symmetrical) YqeK [Bacilli bacterium]